MKCPVCTYLNTREEARKHLNKQTIAILGNAHRQLRSLEQVATDVVKSNCSVHSDSATLTNDLKNIVAFSSEMKALIGLYSSGIPEMQIKIILSKYPDPRKK